MSRQAKILTLVLSINLSLVTLSTPSHAWIGGDIWGAIKGGVEGAVEVITDAAGDLVECVGSPVDCGKAVGQWFENRWAELMTTGCTDRSTFGVDTSCFSDSTFARLNAGMGFAHEATSQGYTYVQDSHAYSPLSYIRDNTDQFYSGGSEAAQRAFMESGEKDANATNYGSGSGIKSPVMIWPAAYSVYPTNVAFSSMLIHEAQHSHYGEHTCGDGADADDKGPYGTQVRYLLMNYRGHGPDLSEFDRQSALQAGVSKVSQICTKSYQDSLLDLATSQDITVQQHYCSNNICSDDIPAQGTACHYRQHNNGVYWLSDWDWNDAERITTRTYRCHPPGYVGTTSVRKRTPSRYKSARFNAPKAPTLDGTCFFGGKARVWVLYHQSFDWDATGAAVAVGYYECTDQPSSEEFKRVEHQYPVYCWTQGKDWDECNWVHELTAGQCVLPSNGLGTYRFVEVEYQFKDDYAGQYAPKSIALYQCRLDIKASPLTVVRSFKYDLTDDYLDLSTPCWGEPYSPQSAACYHAPAPPATAGPCYTLNAVCGSYQDSEYELIDTTTFDWRYEARYKCKERNAPCASVPPGAAIPDLYKRLPAGLPQPGPVYWMVPELDVSREFFPSSGLRAPALTVRPPVTRFDAGGVGEVVQREVIQTPVAAAAAVTRSLR